MPGLIPLMLNPVAAGSRSSIIFPHPRPTKHNSQRYSIDALSLPSYSPRTPSFPFDSLPATSHRSSMPSTVMTRPIKRLSQASPAALPILPYTPEEWRRTIATVKRQHSKRLYRACFTRCNEVLDNIKNTSDTKPIYLISLHFYAATAMEMCGRQLSVDSPYRAGLFQRAREHYDHAASLIREAEESAHIRNRLSLSPLLFSSPLSPAGSTSSRAWTPDTGLSSPSPSVCSSEDFGARFTRSHSTSLPVASSSPGTARKKVSFEMPIDKFPVPQPHIRPDSPTLGFDDEYFNIGLSLQNLPDLPYRPQTLLVTPLVLGAEDSPVTPSALKEVSISEYGVSRSEFDVSRRFLEEDFSSSDSYCARLSDLSLRVAQHRANLDAISSVAVDSETSFLDRSPTPVEDECQTSQRKARIERLRKIGWQRKRFDPSRYEALRNAALAELD